MAWGWGGEVRGSGLRVLRIYDWRKSTVGKGWGWGDRGTGGKSPESEGKMGWSSVHGAVCQGEVGPRARRLGWESRDGESGDLGWEGRAGQLGGVGSSKQRRRVPGQVAGRHL